MSITENAVINLGTHSYKFTDPMTNELTNVKQDINFKLHVELVNDISGAKVIKSLKVVFDPQLVKHQNLTSGYESEDDDGNSVLELKQGGIG